VRIAMLGPISWRTPPRHYGPWELVTSLLTEALVARGVDVTLFATADSETAGTLAAVCPRPYSEDPSIDAKVWELLHAAHVFERAGEFDLIHNQADFAPLAFSRLVATPMVTTIHGFSSERIVPVFARYNDRVSYVSISDADRHPSLNYAATIHHGIPLDDFPFDPAGGESLLFFGRIHSDKGAAEAIEAARCADRRLVMAGIIQDQDYFNRRIAPAIDGKRCASQDAWRGPRAVASDQLRRAVRPLRRRGDGLRDPGHRLQTGLDARTHRAPGDRLPGRHPGRGRRSHRTDR
jgi:glycosyltransferase involved in cell wall biosynthesis